MDFPRFLAPLGKKKALCHPDERRDLGEAKNI